MSLKELRITPEWDLALEVAAKAVLQFRQDCELAELIRAMKGADRRDEIVAAMRADDQEFEAEVDRGIFQAIETGLIRDNGDGTFSITDEGRAYVERMGLRPQ